MLKINNVFEEPCTAWQEQDTNNTNYYYGQDNFKRVLESNIQSPNKFNNDHSLHVGVGGRREEV